MEEIVDALLSRLFNKGLVSEEVPWFIIDVLNIIKRGGEFTVTTVKQDLL